MTALCNWPWTCSTCGGPFAPLEPLTWPANPTVVHINPDGPYVGFVLKADHEPSVRIETVREAVHMVLGT